jgi:hypothetical protein
MNRIDEEKIRLWGCFCIHTMKPFFVVKRAIKTNIFDDVFLSASLPLRRVPDGHEEGENKAQQLGLWKERRVSS